MHWLPKLVANISSLFHRLVNTGVIVGSLVKCLPIKHLQIRNNLSGLLLPNWNWLHPIVIAFNTLCPLEFYIQWCVALHQTHWGSNFEKLICPCFGSLFSQKATTVGSPLNFQSSYLNRGELLNQDILSHCYFIRLILNIFLKTLHILQKDTKVGSQNDCLVCSKWFGWQNKY